MKRLLLVLVLLMTAGSLFAAELKVSGDAMVRGTYWSDDATGEDVAYSYFDYDFNLNMALVANEKATVYLKLTHDRDVVGSGKVADGNGLFADTSRPALNPGAGTAPFNPEDGAYGLNVERAYINYKFAPFLQLNTGLMAGGLWASSFNDNEVNIMRVQVIGALSPDMVFIATYQKNDEWGADYQLKDSEANDETYYYLAARMKFGALTVLPLLTYATKGINHDGSLDGAAIGYTADDKFDITVMSATLGLNGDFGMFGFESEFVYTIAKVDDFIGINGGEDKKMMGAYINAFAKVDALKAGFIYAYASADETDGIMSMGSEFTPLQISNDWVADALAGTSLYMIYGEYTMDKITAKAAVAYASSNLSGDDYELMEYNIGAAYAFDANTTYELGLGYATYDDGTDEVAVTRLYHKFSVTF